MLLSKDLDGTLFSACGLYMLIAWILGTTAWAASPSCARLKRMHNIQASVKVVEHKQNIRYRRISRRQLTRKSGNKDTLGLTVAPLLSSIEIQTAIIERENSLCVFVEDVIFSIGYEQQMVYIDQRYAPSTCPYKVIIEHENLHVQYNTDSFRRYKRQFGLAVKRHFRSVDILEIPKSRSAQRTIQRWLNNQNKVPALKRIQKELSNLQDRKHSRIDSEHSYNMAKRKCDNW